MPIVIRGISGHHADKTYEFDATKQEIKFGRSPGSDILFPPDDIKISRQHLSLSLENDRYKIKLQADNPVYLNNEEVFPDDEIPLGIHKLGVGLEDSAEQFELSVTSQDEQLAATAPGYKVKQSAQKQTKKLSKAVIAGITAVVILGGVAFQTLYNTSSKLDDALSQLATQSEKANVRASFEQRILDNRESVYLVAVRNGDGLIGQGTAWVVGDGMLATNAHVVEGLRQAYEDSNGLITAVVVSPSGPEYQQHNVVDMQIHPHYEAFSEHQSQAYRLLDDGTPLQLTPAYDVGILMVDHADKLAKPLTIAADDALLSLDSGQDLAFIGYPMEDAVGGGFNYNKPTPQVQFGAITSVTDYFMVADDARRNQLIQHSLPAHGGASGSPVFDINGHVVALFNAGNVIFVGGHRISTGIGVNFAQRVDVLNELLRNNIESVEAERFAFWGDRLSQYKTPPQLILNDWKLNMAYNGYDLDTFEEDTLTQTLSEYSDDHGIYYWEYTVPYNPERTYLIIANPSTDTDVDIMWNDDDGDTVAKDQSREPFAVVDSRQWPAMQQNTLIVYTAEDPTDFTLSVYSLSNVLAD